MALITYFDHVRMKAIEIAPSTGAAVRPIYRDNDGSPDFIGSAVAIRLPAQSFLLTAAHVLDGVGDRPWIDLAGSVRPLSQRPIKTTCPPAGRLSDLFDFGAVPLTDEEAAGIPADAFVDSSELEYGLGERGGANLYSLLGFPETSVATDPSNFVTSATRRHWIGVERREKEYVRLGYKRRYHLLLGWSPKLAVGPKGVGPPFRLPGMSGGGVWKVQPYADYSSSLRPRLVALFVEKTRKDHRVLASVRIGVIMRNLAEHFPSVAKHLDGRGIL